MPNRWSRCFLSWTLIALCGSLTAMAQEIPPPVVNPAGVRLTLAVTDAGPFREVQMIRGTIAFEWQRPAATSAGSEPVWHLSGYLVDPPIGEGILRCGVPEHPCTRFLGMYGRDFVSWGGGRPKRDDAQLIRITESLPALPPGNYRIAAVAKQQRVVQGDHPPRPEAIPRPVLAVSNWLPITIEAASEAWIQQTLRQLRLSPDPPGPDERPGAHREWLDHIHQLQLLDHPAAWEVIASTQFGGQYLQYDSIYSTRHPEVACSWLRQGIDDPNRRIDTHHLRAMMIVCARAELPPLPISGAAVPIANPVERAANIREHFEQRKVWQQKHVNDIGTRLLASMARREGRNRADALQALLPWVPSAEQMQLSSEGRMFGMPQPGVGWANSSRLVSGQRPTGAHGPSWTAGFRAELPKWVASLDPATRGVLLRQIVHYVESPEWAPVLESELRQLSPRDAADTSRNLIYQLARLDPEGAADVIAAELRKPETWLLPEMLELLPTTPNRFTDTELVDLLAGRPFDAGGLTVWEAAVARLASPQAAPRIREIYQERLPACQTALVGYFVRADPDYASTLLGSSWNMRAHPSPCLWERLSKTAAFGMGPVLEEFLAAHLFHSLVPLKHAAAESLARFGSSAAQEPLWKAMRHFHEYWKGREALLAQNGEGTMFEMTLLRALAYGQGWTLGLEQLQQLRDLCTGEYCVQQADGFLQLWRQPLWVNAMQSGRELSGAVAHYRIASREELLSRLKQLPAGVRIRLSVSGPEAAILRQAILAEAASAGLVVEQ